MNLVIPTSRFDTKLLPDLAKVIKKFGPYKGHRLIVVPTETAVQEANDFCASIASLFDAAVVEPVTLNVEGWPIAPNRMWREIALLMQRKYGQDHWFLMEPDVTPVADLWLQALDTEYKKSGKPYMGCIVPTRHVRRLPDGRTERTTIGEHMVGGVAIYPPYAASKSVLITTLDRQMVWAREPLEPYDVRMRFEIVPHAKHSDSICHRWGTVNYAQDGDTVTCSPSPNNPEGTDHSGPIPAGTLVVHGCKDGSLAKLVLGGWTCPAAKAVKEKPAQQTVTSDSAETTTITVEPEPQPKPEPVSFEGYQIRKAALAEPGCTAKSLAEKLGMDEEKVKEFIRSPSSGFKLGPRGKVVAI
jgi:hypothetical protein